MRSFLLGSLLAGGVYLVLGPLFVHFVLPPEITAEFVRVFREIEGNGDTSAPGWLHIALVLAMRLSFGVITMLLFAWLRRGRGRVRAAALAGAGSLLPYVALLALQCSHGLPWHVAAIGLGYCVVETQIAAHSGAIAWGRPVPAP